MVSFFRFFSFATELCPINACELSTTQSSSGDSGKLSRLLVSDRNGGGGRGGKGGRGGWEVFCT